MVCGGCTEGGYRIVDLQGGGGPRSKRIAPCAELIDGTAEMLGHVGQKVNTNIWGEEDTIPSALCWTLALLTGDPSYEDCFELFE